MNESQRFQSACEDLATNARFVVVSADWLVREAVARLLGAVFAPAIVDTVASMPVRGSGAPTIAGMIAIRPASDGISHTLLLAAPDVGATSAPATDGSPVLSGWRDEPGTIVAAVADLLRADRGMAVHHGNSRRTLTRRQLEVVSLIARGKPNAEIASTLGMSENTVRIHVSAILKTLGLANRTQAALWAMNNLSIGGHNSHT